MSEPLALSAVGASDPLWSTRLVCQHLCLSDRQLRRLLSSAKFPRPDLRIGRSLRWRRSTIEAFVERLAEAEP